MCEAVQRHQTNTPLKHLVHGMSSPQLTSCYSFKKRPLPGKRASAPHGSAAGPANGVRPALRRRAATVRQIKTRLAAPAATISRSPTVLATLASHALPQLD